jgi:hypothetical protein
MCAPRLLERFRDIGVACVSGGAGDTNRTHCKVTLGLASLT